MDPLSVIESTSTLLGFTIHISSKLYAASLHSGAPGISRLLMEASSLRTLFQELESTVLKIHTPVALSLLPSLYEECLDTLRRIAAVLSEDPRSGEGFTTLRWRVFENNPSFHGWSVPPMETENFIMELQKLQERLQRW